ncbi:MAG TPA: hypothetical protein VGI60_01845 [Chthoniobacterales bacterium]|jgi:hypothetical protein
MKTITLESFRVLESVLFWSAALPSALLAWPALILADKAKNLFHITTTTAPPKQLNPGMA